jgi:hypothetical protein
VQAAIYGNPWWEIIQITAALGSVMAAIKLGDVPTDLAMKIGTFPPEFAERRARLRADAKKSEVEELRALIEIDAMAEDALAFVSTRAIKDSTSGMTRHPPNI